MTSFRTNLAIGLLGLAVVAFAIALIIVVLQNYHDDSDTRGEFQFGKFLNFSSALGIIGRGNY